MAHRSLLRKTRLEELKTWLDLNDIYYRPGRGIWQILQILHPEHSWQALFINTSSKEYYVVPSTLYTLITTFLEEKDELA